LLKKKEKKFFLIMLRRALEEYKEWNYYIPEKNYYKQKFVYTLDCTILSIPENNYSQYMITPNQYKKIMTIKSLYKKPIWSLTLDQLQWISFITKESDYELIITNELKHYIIECCKKLNMLISDIYFTSEIKKFLNQSLRIHQEKDLPLNLVLLGFMSEIYNQECQDTNNFIKMFPENFKRLYQFFRIIIDSGYIPYSKVFDI
jgi:hypothetical protein